MKKDPVDIPFDAHAVKNPEFDNFFPNLRLFQGRTHADALLLLICNNTYGLYAVPKKDASKTAIIKLASI